jgi:hypothetical protein
MKLLIMSMNIMYVCRSGRMNNFEQRSHTNISNMEYMNMPYETCILREKYEKKNNNLISRMRAHYEHVYTHKQEKIKNACAQIS